MQKSFPLSKIKPNPFRYMDRYPIQRDKVEALKQSFRRTGFWENIVRAKSRAMPRLPTDITGSWLSRKR